MSDFFIGHFEAGVLKVRQPPEGATPQSLAGVAPSLIEIL